MFSKPPTGLSRLFMRAPIWVYRLGLGWLLGGRFLLLEHRGRSSGKRRSAVIEVVGHDRSTGAYWVAAAYGDRSDWYRNVKVDSRVRVTVGRRRFKAVASALSADESKLVLERYEVEHPAAARGLVRVLGYESFEALKDAVPIVELRPRA